MSEWRGGGGCVCKVGERGGGCQDRPLVAELLESLCEFRAPHQVVTADVSERSRGCVCVVGGGGGGGGGGECQDRPLVAELPETLGEFRAPHRVVPTDVSEGEVGVEVCVGGRGCPELPKHLASSERLTQTGCYY